MRGVTIVPEHEPPCHSFVARLCFHLSECEEDVMMYYSLHGDTKDTAKNSEDDEAIVREIRNTECDDQCAPPTMPFDRRPTYVIDDDLKLGQFLRRSHTKLDLRGHDSRPDRK